MLVVYEVTLIIFENCQQQFSMGDLADLVKGFKVKGGGLKLAKNRIQVFKQYMTDQLKSQISRVIRSRDV